MKAMKAQLLLFLLFILLVPLFAQESCKCTANPEGRDTAGSKALPLKLVAIASILTAGALGFLIPILGRSVSVLRPENDAFFVIKAFAGGVILATGLVHILPDAFDRLTSSCIGGDPSERFPFAGFIAMMSAMVTMMVDSFATGYYKRSQLSKAQPVEGEEMDAERLGFRAAEEGHVGNGAQTHEGHVHGPAAVSPAEASMSESIRNRVVSQVLELGIVVHSVIIGVSLGTSLSPSAIRPLVGALSFHQFFEGIGLGGCIVQASFKTRATVIMAVFFSLTAPIGIVLGIAISTSYDEMSPAALIVEGVLDAASAGILIYMALVDFLAADFMNPRMQNNGKLQLGANLALLLGSGSMSLVARWA